jgi:hypothetical protein
VIHSGIEDLLRFLRCGTLWRGSEDQPLKAQASFQSNSKNSCKTERESPKLGNTIPFFACRTTRVLGRDSEMVEAHYKEDVVLAARTGHSHRAALSSGRHAGLFAEYSWGCKRNKGQDQRGHKFLQGWGNHVKVDSRTTKFQYIQLGYFMKMIHQTNQNYRCKHVACKKGSLLSQWAFVLATQHSL